MIHSSHRLAGALLLLLVPTVSGAQSDNQVPPPEITNATIEKILKSRTARVGRLNAYKASGAVGENNRALVQGYRLRRLSAQERSATKEFIQAENADRMRMFRAIAAATGTDLSQLPRIRKTYASTLRQKACPGDWIQQPDGSWTQKR